MGSLYLSACSFYMPRFTSEVLLLPDASRGWSAWREGQVLATAPELLGLLGGLTGKPALTLGLPARACRTLGLILPMAEHALLEAMVLTQLEKQGIKPSEENLWRWQLLGQQAGRAVISADVLAEPFPTELLAVQVQDCVPALRLSGALAAGQLLVLAEELGDVVLAVGYEGRLYHSHIIGPMHGLAAETLACEVQLVGLTLAQDLGSVSSVLLHGSERLQNMAAELRTRLPGWTVACAGPQQPAVIKPQANQRRLLPARVAAAQAQARQKQRVLRATVLGGLLVMSLLFLAYAYLHSLEKEAAQLAETVATQEKPAAEVRQTAASWRALAPALEPKRYAMVQMAQMTRLLPPSGIVLKKISLQTDSIDLQGEARDAQTAVQFVDDLQKHPALSRYQWSKAPATLRGKAAEFRTQGKAQP
jgi:Tfp pilus assembly protein PilN